MATLEEIFWPIESLKVWHGQSTSKALQVFTICILIDLLILGFNWWAAGQGEVC